MALMHGSVADTKTTVAIKLDASGGTSLSHVAGEEQADSKYSSQQRATQDAKYSAQDISVNGPTTIYAGSCRLLGIYINTVLSAHTVDITDDGTTVITLPASLAAGTFIDLPGIRCSALEIAPNASSTGNVVVFYREAKFTD